MVEQRVILIDESRVPAEERHGEVIIHKFPFRIGRASKGAVTSNDLYPGSVNDLPIHETRQPYNVSRYHVEIGFSDGVLYVRDLGSAAGTIVNGRKIGGNRRSEFVLVDTDTVELILGKSSSPWRFRLLVTQGPGRPRVVVADDEEAIRKLMAKSLSDIYEVIEAADGREALEACLSSPPDAVLLDWMMPKIDGVRVCKALKTNLSTARVPILMVTAKTETVDRIAGIEAGADDYIPKPFEMEELLTRLNAAVSRSRRIRDTDWVTGLLSEEGFRRELDMLLAENPGKPDRAIALLILRGLSDYQAAAGPGQVDHLLREIAQHIWKRIVEVPRALAARCGLNVFALSASTAATVRLAGELKTEIGELLADSLVRVRIEVHKLKRGDRSFLDFVERLG